VDLSALQLWERSALRPSQGNVPPRRVRQRPEESGASRVRELRRAREVARRMRYTVTHGLFLSVLIGAPVGWSFVRSALLAGDPAVSEACPDFASFLSPALQRNVKELRAAGVLSRSERQVLGLKVCDPGVRLLVEPLLRGVSDLDELRALANGEAPIEASLRPLPALRSLTARP